MTQSVLIHFYCLSNTISFISFISPHCPKACVVIHVGFMSQWALILTVSDHWRLRALVVINYAHLGHSLGLYVEFLGTYSHLGLNLFSEVDWRRLELCCDMAALRYLHAVKHGSGIATQIPSGFLRIQLSVTIDKDVRMTTGTQFSVVSESLRGVCFLLFYRISL